MYKIISTVAALASMTAASHLDNINGMFDTFSFDEVKFKTRTNCSLDKYPEVSPRTDPATEVFQIHPLDIHID